MNDTSWGVLGGILGALITAIGAAVLKIMDTRHQQQKEVRIEALTEYKGLVDQLSTRVNTLQSEVAKLYEAHTQCREENAELRGELRALRASLERHSNRAGEDGPASLAEADLVTDSTGVITRVKPGTLALFGYPEQELVGKDLKVLLPTHFHEDLDRNLARLRGLSIPSPAVRADARYALTRDGTEAPLALYLRAFEEAGKRLVGVAVHRRVDGE